MSSNVEVIVVDATPEPASRAISPYIVALHDTAVLIDAGPAVTAERIIDELDARGLKLGGIVLTHIHLDHGGGAGSLAKKLGVKVYVHPRGARHLVNPEKLWHASKQFLGGIADYYGKPEPVPESLVVPVSDGSVISVGGLSLRAVHTPGHASHHMSLLFEGRGILFTGDSAGVRLVAPGDTVYEIPTNPPPFKPRLYMESLVRMASLRPARVALGHYGIQAEDGVSYLRRHAESIVEWFKAAMEAYNVADGDFEGFKKLVAAKIEEAARAAASGDPIIEGFFLYGALAGLMDAIARGEDLPVEPPPLPA